MTKVSTNTLPSHSKRSAPKAKATRIFGENLWGSAKAPVTKRPTNPGQHGGRRKKMTDYGIQLREKQKMKNRSLQRGSIPVRLYIKQKGAEMLNGS